MDRTTSGRPAPPRTYRVPIVLTVVCAAVCTLAILRGNAREAVWRAEFAALAASVAAQSEVIARLESRLEDEIASRPRRAAAWQVGSGSAASAGTEADGDDGSPRAAGQRPAAASLGDARREMPPSSSALASASAPSHDSLSPIEAETIRRQVRRVEADRIVRTWQYRREAWLANPDAFAPEVLNPMRAGLGDEVYERYLEAKGRTTTVGVSGLAEASAGATAGLQPGDQITHYDGQRVFHLNELQALSVQGEPGTYVEVQVRRGEQVLYLVLPRGPLGVTAHHRSG